MLADPGIDLLLLQAELPRAPGMDRAEANMRAAEAVAARAKKPIVQFSMGSYGLTDYSRDFRAHLTHLPCLQEVDKALRAVRTIADYAARMNEPRPIAPPAADRARREQLEKWLTRQA